MIGERFIDELEEASRTGEVSDFVNERHNELTGQTSAITFAAGDRISYHYIHPETAVKAIALSKGFRVNDLSPYSTFATKVLELMSESEDCPASDIVLNGVQLAVMDYFGVRSNGDKRQRKRIHGGLFRGKVKDLQVIADSKTAMCMERAALSQNLCMLAGIPTGILTGRISVDYGLEQGHGFQIVSTDSQSHVFDVTNPHLEIKNGFGKVKPNVSAVDATDFLVGGLQHENDLEISVDGEEQVKHTIYKHEASFPATFEGFDALTFYERDAIGNMRHEQLRRRAIVDAAIHLAESTLYIGG
jgi:hypothetical protein